MMKYLGILFIVIALATFSCKNRQNKVKERKVTISGIVSDYDSSNGSITLIINSIAFDSKRKNIKPDSSGYFLYQFHSRLPKDIRIKANKANFLVLTHPGDSIHVKFKYKEPEFWNTISFSGDRITENNQIVNFQENFKKRKIERQSIIKSKKEKSIDEFKHFMDSVKDHSLDIAEKFIDKNGASTEVANWIRWYASFPYFYNLYLYPIDRNIKVPVKYYDFQNEFLPITNEMLSATHMLSMFVNQYYYGYVKENIWQENKKKFRKWGKMQQEGVLDEAIKQRIDSIFITGILNYAQGRRIKELVLTHWLSQQLKHKSLEAYEQNKQIIDNVITSGFLKEPILKQYHQTKKRIKNPEVASNAILNKMENTSIENIIDSIRIENKGKMIYMDCWAPWCAPCMKEMPHSKKLMSEMKDRNVAFVYVCLNSEEKQWRATLDELQIGGQHYFLNNAQSSTFREIFEVQGIPHYILFNKKGTIIEKGSHLRPDNAKDKIVDILTN